MKKQKPSGKRTSFQTEVRQALAAEGFRRHMLWSNHSNRFDYFWEIRRHPLLSDALYWELLGETWTGTEAIEPNQKAWLRLFNARRGHRESLMNDAERAALAAMPDTIEIWRGCGHPAGVHGMSWTVNREKAIWFSHYAGGPRRTGMNDKHSPLVVHGFCPKAEVLAYFEARKESEIVVNPKHIKQLPPIAK